MTKMVKELLFQRLKSNLKFTYKRQLIKVVELHSRSQTIEAPVGLLTGTHRDTWSGLYKHLYDLDPTNRKSFETIQSALVNILVLILVFCLVGSFPIR